jgi:thioredoxin-like negative regulator of GroEL
MNDAIARHRKMVEQFPDHELPRFSLGKALFEAEQYVEARAHFGAALKLKPEWMAVQILLARCELNLGNAEAARAALLRARELAMQQNHAGPKAEVEQLLEDLG